MTIQRAHITAAPPVTLVSIQENKAAYFAELRKALNPGPTLRDLAAWRNLRRNEKKYLLAIAGFSKLGRHGGKGQSDIDLYSSIGWDKLPDHARSRLRVAAKRLRQTLSDFGRGDDEK